MRGYRSTRVVISRNLKTWCRLVTLPRSLGGVAYGVMFDLTALSHASLTVSAIATGSGPQVKKGSKVWVFVCHGTHVGKELAAQEWGQIGEGVLELPRPSFKAADYGDYGELPITKSFVVYPNQTMVCLPRPRACSAALSGGSRIPILPHNGFTCTGCSVSC